MKYWYDLRSDTRTAARNPQSVPITSSFRILTLASSSLSLGRAIGVSFLMREIYLSKMTCSSSPSSFRQSSIVKCDSRLDISSCFSMYSYRSSKAIRMKFHGRSCSWRWSKYWRASPRSVNLRKYILSSSLSSKSSQIYV